MENVGRDVNERSLGTALQQARQAKGLTQQELCQQADLSYSTLAKIERGAIKTPSVFTVARLASVLGVSLDALLGVAGGSSPSVANSPKRKSKSGISFLYVDINGCLVHFFHTAFTKIAQETGISDDFIESTFWHYNDAVCLGEMTMEEFNHALAEKFGMKSMDWAAYYLEAVEPIMEMHELVRWASQGYRVGLLTNIMPGLIEAMIQNGTLPSIPYDAIIDSSVVQAIKPEEKIYQIATTQAGVPATEILFVDDSRTNLMAAERLGWRVLWFDDMRPAESAAKVRTALEY
jgi:FMN phosphatase YigB (HAD superfamily)/DNA-binding XRE family transcriptional regulator